METITRHSRNMLTVIVGLLLLFSLSCSDDPSSPKKEDEDPIPQDVVTIGVEGGTVVKGDFTISIPEGAFTEDHEISLNEVDDDGAFGENSVSTSYKINGFPSKYNKPIVIKSKYSGQLNGNTFLAIGQMSVNIIENDSSVVYGLYPATDSSGVLTSSFPAFSNSNLSKSTKKNNELESLELFVKFLDSYAYKETNHFVIFFPLSAIQHVSKVEEMFEEAYAVVKHGLQKQFDESISMVIVILSQSNPVEVNQVDFQDSQDFQKYYIVREYNISKESLAGQQYNDIQVRAVQELFYFTARSTFENMHWMVSAIYYWIEDLISDAPDYKYPKYLLERGLLPFWGFQEEKDPLTHESKKWASSGEQGKGMLGVVKYLTQLESFGIGGLGKYSTISKNYSTSDILDAIGVPYNQWWPDFFKKYVNNEIFDLPDDYFINRAHAKWDINSEEDVSKTFTSTEVGTYQDLSAKIFKINFNYTKFDNSQDLIFELTNNDNNTDLALLLFTVKNGKPQYLLTSHSKTIRVDDIKSLIDINDKQILAIVVNNDITTEDYLGESDIDLSIKITPKIEIELPTYNKCKISLDFIISEHYEYTTTSPTDITKKFSYGTPYVEGSFIGNTFTGSYAIPNHSGTISATLNSTLDTLKSITWLKDGDFDYGSGDKLELTATIPLNSTGSATFRWFEVNGDAVCTAINHFDYTTFGSDWSSTTTGYDCNEVSRLYVSFIKE